MWPWPLIVMLLWVLGNCLVSPAANAKTRKPGPDASTASAEISPSSTGPATEAEALILWEKAEAAFSAGKYSDALYPLQRLTDRYPGTPHFIEAHLLLGRSYLYTEQYKTAAAPLKYFIDSVRGRSPATLQARLYLGQAQLGLARFNEAYLSASSVIAALDKSGKDPDIVHDALRKKALLIKSHSLIGKNKDALAIQSLDSAKALLNSAPDSNPELAALAVYSDFLSLQLKLRACGRLAEKGPLDELQTQDMIERRGVCLQESLLILRNLIKSGNPSFSRQGVDLVKAGFASYARTCAEPPAPTGKRTPIEAKRYKAELVQHLKSILQANHIKSKEILSSWKPELTGDMNWYITNLLESLD